MDAKALNDSPLIAELRFRANLAKVNEQGITASLHTRSADSIELLETALRRIAFDKLSYSLMAEIARDALAGVVE